MAMDISNSNLQKKNCSIDMIQNTAEIRSYNRKQIVDCILSHEYLTKKQISDELSLSITTVSNLCNQLVKEGILETTSSNSSGGGRIPELYSINPNSKYIICINDIHENYSRIALLNLKKEIVAQKKLIYPYEKYKNIINLHRQTLDEMVNNLNISWDKILGAGVAVPGIFNKTTELVVGSTVKILENLPLKKDLEEALGIPVFLENESHLLVLASAISNANINNSQNMIYIYTGLGLGVGIICNGRLVTGSYGLGGGINHIPLGLRNYKCYCGKEGCIETELSRSGYLRKYYSHDFAGNDDLSKPWDEFVRNVLRGDVSAVSVVEENGRLLGKVISVLINIFDPEIIHIGGATEDIYDKLYPYILEEVTTRTTVQGSFHSEIIKSTDCNKLLFEGCGSLVLVNWKL
jgi:predicted NBD/HSP70 family sugar kinase